MCYMLSACVCLCASTHVCDCASGSQERPFYLRVLKLEMVSYLDAFNLPLEATHLNYKKNIRYVDIIG